MLAHIIEFRVFDLISHKEQRVWGDSKSPDAQQTHYAATMSIQQCNSIMMLVQEDLYQHQESAR